jgi:hypothetical protein
MLALALAFLVLAASALFLERERSIAHVRGFPLDDSWIHAVFARNIADGQGSASTRASASRAPPRRSTRSC